MALYCPCPRLLPTVTLVVVSAPHLSHPCFLLTVHSSPLYGRIDAGVRRDSAERAIRIRSPGHHLGWQALFGGLPHVFLCFGKAPPKFCALCCSCDALFVCHPSGPIALTPTVSCHNQTYPNIITRVVSMNMIQYNYTSCIYDNYMSRIYDPI